MAFVTIAHDVLHQTLHVIFSHDVFCKSQSFKAVDVIIALLLVKNHFENILATTIIVIKF